LRRVTSASSILCFNVFSRALARHSSSSFCLCKTCSSSSLSLCSSASPVLEEFTPWETSFVRPLSSLGGYSSSVSSLTVFLFGHAILFLMVVKIFRCTHKLWVPDVGWKVQVRRHNSHNH
jgi:hypothetical protein